MSPNDNELRTTTVKLTGLSAQPTVEVLAGQTPDTDGKEQYRTPVVAYDAASKTATVTIESNGWVELKLSGLSYETALQE